MNYFFSSPRLGFRKFQESDIETFVEMNADSEVMEFFPSTLTEEESIELTTKINDHIKDHGFGFFAVDHLKSKEFIGFIGMKKVDFETDFTPAVEIGWRLHKKFWNKGLATEGAERCLKFAFNVLEIEEIVSFTSLNNSPSEKVMQKIGMTKAGEFTHPKLGKEHLLSKHCLYRLTKNEFLERMVEA